MNEKNLRQKKEILFKELKEIGIKQDILEAMEKVKREFFVPEEYIPHAYANYPLSIGKGQTISQPYTVAYMIQLLDLKPGDKVLEIGSGSGYNAAVMSKMVGKKGKIISLEIIEDLVELAKNNLKRVGVNNVKVIHKSGTQGYEQGSPYDKIIVTAGGTDIPEKLLEQLREGGILVMPVTSDSHEIMTRIVKEKDLKKTEHGPFRFVPLKIRGKNTNS